MDFFLHNHQSALDSFMEDKAIQDLEDAGIYPVPDNDAILENLFEEELERFMKNRPYNSIEVNKIYAGFYARKRFEELPEPLDNS